MPCSKPRPRAGLPDGGPALLLLGALFSCACSAPRRPPPPEPSRHIVLVTIDTLRADRLGCYGARDVLTPNLDRIAGEGALAPRAMSHVPLTRPSHVSIFTGLLPTRHGIRDNVSPALDPAIPTLATLLKGAGFLTAGFVSSVVLSRQSGLDRGFDVYADRFEADSDDARFLNAIQKRGDQTLGEALDWLEQADAARRLFAWVHLYDPHDPYDPPEPWASRYAGRPYDGEVAWTDELVGRLDAALERRGLGDQTLLVVTADHGESLGEHAESTHGFFVYQATLSVPLLLRGPGVVPGVRLAATARGVDVLPTALDLLGLAELAAPDLAGRSFGPELRGGPALPELPTYAESLMPLLHYGWSDLRTLREGRFKYVQAPRPELYDLASDPGELHDLASRDPAKAAAMRAALTAFVESEKSVPGGAAGVPPDLLEKLGALGYLGAGAAGPASEPGADPKDKVEEFRFANGAIREGLLRLGEKDFAGSAASFKKLVDAGVLSFEVHYYYGRALLGLDRFAPAAEQFEGAIRYQPAYGPAHAALAEARAAQGDTRGAIAALREGREAAPRDGSLPRAEARYWLRLGETREAIAAYEAALPLSPGDALLRVRLGELLRDRGDLDRAAALMHEAVSREPAVASYWNALGMVLGGKGDLAGAEGAFREATGRDAANAQYAYNLGLALLRQEKWAEAEAQLRRVLELEPGFTAARSRLAEIGKR